MLYLDQRVLNYKYIFVMLVNLDNIEFMLWKELKKPLILEVVGKD